MRGVGDISSRCRVPCLRSECMLRTPLWAVKRAKNIAWAEPTDTRMIPAMLRLSPATDRVARLTVFDEGENAQLKSSSKLSEPIWFSAPGPRRCTARFMVEAMAMFPVASCSAMPCVML